MSISSPFSRRANWEKTFVDILHYFIEFYKLQGLKLISFVKLRFHEGTTGPHGISTVIMLINQLHLIVTSLCLSLIILLTYNTGNATLL